MGEDKFCIPSPSKSLNQYVYRFNYINKSAQGVDVLNLVWIDSAVTDLHVRENTRFRVDPFVRATGQFSADFNV